MTLELELRKVGDSIGLILPEEVLAFLKVAEGDVVLLREGEAGTLHFVSKKAEIAHQMAVFANLSERYKNTLRELAK